MHSSSADWVFGDARLISSPTTMFANTGPGLNSNSRRSWLYALTPVMSLGSRSGVNWMRCTEQWVDRPSALASMVFPTPGTSSISTCPSASSTVSASRTAPAFPSITDSMASPIAMADLHQVVERALGALPHVQGHLSSSLACRIPGRRPRCCRGRQCDGPYRQYVLAWLARDVALQVRRPSGGAGQDTPLSLPRYDLAFISSVAGSGQVLKR